MSEESTTPNEEVKERFIEIKLVFDEDGDVNAEVSQRCTMVGAANAFKALGEIMASLYLSGLEKAVKVAAHKFEVEHE